MIVLICFPGTSIISNDMIFDRKLPTLSKIEYISISSISENSLQRVLETEFKYPDAPTRVIIKQSMSKFHLI